MSIHRTIFPHYERASRETLKIESALCETNEESEVLTSGLLSRWAVKHFCDGPSPYNLSAHVKPNSSAVATVPRTIEYCSSQFVDVAGRNGSVAIVTCAAKQWAAVSLARQRQWRGDERLHINEESE